MAIYGIGASHNDGSVDVSKEFISRECACVGWKKNDVSASLHKILKYIKMGDLIYIKSYHPAGELKIKAVGIVFDDKIDDYGNLGKGVNVKWVFPDEVNMRKIEDKYNVRSNTLYEEMNPKIQKRIIELLLSKIK